MSTNGSLNRKLRMALVGGGQGAFIGRVHATAAVMDNRAALVAGCLSSSPEKAKASAPDYDIAPERAYTSIKELIEKEKALPADQRIDFVSVATPNHTHFEIAKAAVDAGPAEAGGGWGSSPTRIALETIHGTWRSGSLASTRYGPGSSAR